jgi:MarR family transcriptional regulator, organic hydroperoxide resistance regulator
MSNPGLPLAAEVLHKFLQIQWYLRRYSRQVDSHGIRPIQLSLLRFLLEQGPAMVGEVQKYLYTSASSASTMISQLEECGYVTRTRSAEDNRVVIVELTPAGQEAAEKVPMGGIPLLRRRLNALPEDRLRRIEASLDDIMQLMEVTDDE